MWALLTLVATFGGPLSALAQGTPIQNSSCGPLNSPGQYGPYDARTDLDKLGIVLGRHFRPEVESLIRGTSSATPGGDIDYTLRAIPNHPKALLAMMRLGEKEKSPQPKDSRYTVECWFDRAIRFRPDDTMVRMIYTMFLTQNNRKPEALAQLEIVQKAAEDNAFTHQNVGLLYFDLGDYPQALLEAHKAIALGLDRPDLRGKLQAVGQWREPIAKPNVPEPETLPSPAN